MTPEERTVRELFAALDASDIEDALGLMTEDVDFRFGSVTHEIVLVLVSHFAFVIIAVAQPSCSWPSMSRPSTEVQ